MPKIRRVGPLCLFVCGIVVGPFPANASGHGAIDEQIVAVTKQLEDDPTNAELFLKRGELHRVHRDWDAAVADYNHAARLEPSLAAVDLCLGMLGLESGRFQIGRTALDRFLIQQPDHDRARLTRARTLMRLGHPDSAVEDFSYALTRVPNPDVYLERARAQVAAGDDHIRGALAGLDEALVTLGPLVPLELFAIDLELELKHYAHALERLDRLRQRTPHHGTWPARRGTILEQAGRLAEARMAYAEGLAGLERLPSHRRRSKATAQLETRLRAALVRLTTGQP